jgi:hypothetical protein
LVSALGERHSSNVSVCDQTGKSKSDTVCAVPLWMLQVPRPELTGAQGAFRARTRQQNQIPSET